MYADDLLDGLNDEQRAVAQFDEPAALRVLAGAGTGEDHCAHRPGRADRRGWHACREGAAADVHPARRPPDDRSQPHPPGPCGTAVRRVSGGTFHLRRTARCASTRPDSGLPEGFGARPVGCRRRDGRGARRDGEESAERASVPRVNPPLLDLYCARRRHRHAGGRGDQRGRPVASDRPNPSARCVRRTSRANDVWVCSTSTTCCCTGGRLSRDDPSAVAGRAVRPRARRRVPGCQRPVEVLQLLRTHDPRADCRR